MYRVELTYSHVDKENNFVKYEILSEAENTVGTFFALAFGGAQIRYELNPGVYLSDSEEICVEPSTTFWAFTTSLGENWNLLLKLGAHIAYLLNQESVLVAYQEFVGEIEFVRAGATNSKPP